MLWPQDLVHKVMQRAGGQFLLHLKAKCGIA